jgi:hypothetical protein
MSTPNFHSDYLYRFSQDECHHDFHFWSATSLIGAMLGRRIWVAHGRFILNPNLYIVLCGIAGSGKDSARKVVVNIMERLFPEYMLSASIQSREDIANLMASPECCRIYKCLKSGQMLEYRPFYLIISEMAGFFSVDCRKMIEMLVEMFDSDYFSTGFKKDRALGLKQGVRNPAMSMLGCVQPDWFMSNMKIDLFQRGLGRRMIIVYRDKEKLNPKPSYPSDSQEGWNRVVEHVKRLHKDEIQGQVFLTKEADEWWMDYYMKKDKNRSDDPIIFQFQETRHVILLKLASILSFVHYDFNYKITPIELQVSLALLDSLEPDIRRLTGGIGQNPMAGVQTLMLDLIRLKGMIRYIEVYRTFHKQCPQGEKDFEAALQSLKKQGEIIWFEMPGSAGFPQKWIWTEAGWNKYVEGKVIKPEVLMQATEVFSIKKG